MAKTGEETKPNEVEPSKKVPEGASSGVASASPKNSPKKSAPSSPSPKKAVESPKTVPAAGAVASVAAGSPKKESPKKPSSATPSPKKDGAGGEEKGAGEGVTVPALVLTPPTPPGKPQKEEPKTTQEPKEQDAVTPKKAEAGEGEPCDKPQTAAAAAADAATAAAEANATAADATATAAAAEATEKITDAPAPKLPPPVVIDMSSKETIRMATWNRLETEDMVLFPRPCTGRIPRFKGEVEAVERLAKLDVFKEAKLVKVNLDKAHERLRLEVIQSGKELVAGTPGLREAVFLVMHPPMEPSNFANRKAASKIGIHCLGVALDFAAKQADLVILCSVAVDKKGRRIGKGEGFSDLEFALLSQLGTIQPNAVIATLVHDAQVYDEFPESIFKPYDVPVDLIITPTRVIEVEKKLERPTLRWDLLSKRRINDIPIIKQLLDKEQANGAKIELKEEGSDTETTRRFTIQRRRFLPQRRRQASAPEPRGPIRGRNRRETSAPPPIKGTRTFRRRPRRQTSTSGDSIKGRRPTSESMRENLISKPGRRGPIRRINKPRYTVDFSVKVNGLSSAVRIRDLKAALVERGVRPSDISWRATKGVALLHFAKRRQAQQEAVTALGKSVNEVVASLQGLSVKPEDGPRMDLSVEVAQPLGPKTAPLVGATA